MLRKKRNFRLTKIKIQVEDDTEIFYLNSHERLISSDVEKKSKITNIKKKIDNKIKYSTNSSNPNLLTHIKNNSPNNYSDDKFPNNHVFNCQHTHNDILFSNNNTLNLDASISHKQNMKSVISQVDKQYNEIDKILDESIFLYNNIPNEINDNDSDYFFNEFYV